MSDRHEGEKSSCIWQQSLFYDILCIPYPCIGQYFILTCRTTKCTFINTFSHILFILLLHQHVSVTPVITAGCRITQIQSITNICTKIYDTVTWCYILSTSSFSIYFAQLFPYCLYSCYKIPCGGYRSDRNVLNNNNNNNMLLNIFIKVFVGFSCK